MRIGIAPDLRRNAGGIYQYSVTILDALREWGAEGSSDRFVVLAEDHRLPELRNLKEPRWTIQPLYPPSFKHTVKGLLKRYGLAEVLADVSAPRTRSAQINIDTVKSRPQDRQWLESLGIRLMIYPAPQTRSFETGIPYIMAIHDLQHRLQPEFPEVSANGEWEQREYLFRNGSKQALFLLADSEVGKEDILNCYAQYGVRPEQVKVLPFLPASYLPATVSTEERSRVRARYNLPERYLFYPAQFWPHKNHMRIVQALSLLKRESGIRPVIVLCGSAEGALRRDTFKQLMELAQKDGLESQIMKLGYVPDEDMAALYAESAALVMPTFFGPTNIPFLEAWRFGCPVITSDIRGIREQVGNAAILVDPKSVDSIAEGIRKIWCDNALGETLAASGRGRLGEYTPADFRRRLVDIVEDAKSYAAG